MTDNSGNAFLREQSHVSGEYFEVGTTVVMYEYADFSENIGSCSFAVRINEGKLLIAFISPLYNHMEKPDFLYFEFEAPNRISLIVFRDSSVKFSAKIRKKGSVPF